MPRFNYYPMKPTAAQSYGSFMDDHMFHLRDIDKAIGRSLAGS